MKMLSNPVALSTGALAIIGYILFFPSNTQPIVTQHEEEKSVWICRHKGLKVMFVGDYTKKSVTDLCKYTLDQ